MAKVRRKKDSGEKKDPNEISHEDLDLLNQGIGILDRRFITSLEDPRVQERLRGHAKGLELLKKLRDQAEEVKAQPLPVEEQKKLIRINREEIDRVLGRVYEPRGTSKALPAEQRPQRSSFFEYISRVKEGLREVPDLSTVEIQQRLKQIDQDAVAAIAEVTEPKNGESNGILAGRIVELEREVESTRYNLNTKNEEIAQIMEMLNKILGQDKSAQLSSPVDAITAVIKQLQIQARKKLTLEASLEKAQEQEEKIVSVAESAVNRLIVGVDSLYTDLDERTFWFEHKLGPILEIISSDPDGQIDRIVGKSVSVNLNNSMKLADVVLSEAITAYNFFWANACSEVNKVNAVLEELTETLKQRTNITEEELDNLKRKAERAAFKERGGQRREIDKLLEKMNPEALANELQKARLKITELETMFKSKEKKKGRSREENIAIFNELQEIGKALEAADQYINLGVRGSATSSKTMESLPISLNEIRQGIAQIVIELAGRNEENVEKDREIQALKKDLETKRRDTTFIDPIAQKMYARYAIANKIFQKYAVANDFEPREFGQIKLQNGNIFIGLAENYLSLLSDIRKVVEEVIIPKEKNASAELHELIKNLPSELKNKDIMLARRKILKLMAEEKNRADRLFDANKTLVPEIMKKNKIPLETLLYFTAHEKLSAECIAAYVVPIHSRINAIDSIPERQHVLASKYGYDSFKSLKQEINELNEQLEQGKRVCARVRGIASAGNEKYIRDTKQSVKFINELKEIISSIDKSDSEIFEEKKDIMKRCVVPEIKSYEQFRDWLSDINEKIYCFAGRPAEREYVCGIVSRLDSEAGQDYASSMKYLKSFITQPALAEPVLLLSYFKELKPLLGKDFLSAKEFLAAIKSEEKKAKGYIKAEQARVKKAKELLIPKNNH